MLCSCSLHSGNSFTCGHNSTRPAPLVAVVLTSALPARLSPARQQLTLSSQIFLMTSHILAFTPDHKQHLEQLTPSYGLQGSWLLMAKTAPFSFSVLTEKNQHFILKEKKNNILWSHSELQHHLSCNQDIAELWCYKQTLLIQPQTLWDM